MIGQSFSTLLPSSSSLLIAGASHSHTLSSTDVRVGQNACRPGAYYMLSSSVICSIIGARVVEQTPNQCSLRPQGEEGEAEFHSTNGWVWVQTGRGESGR